MQTSNKMRDEKTGRYLPAIYPEELPYWEGAKKRQLWLQSCKACGKAWFPIGPACPKCFSMDFAWKQMSGRGKIHNYVIYHKAWTPWFEDKVPYAVVQVELDFTAVDRLRNAKKEGFKADEGFSLTYMPFIARAVVDAVRTYPNVNASVADNSLVVHHAVALGIAVDLDFGGLMVPVVRDADGKRMRAIARDIADLASRARSKKLTPDDITGGTFTLSNAGPYGIDLMQSIINQPQVGILSITSVKKKPVVVELPDGSETIAIRPQGMLGLSWDHRAFDGAYAAIFLHEVQKILETRDWSTEL